jgi:DNA repair protein RadC
MKIKELPKTDQPTLSSVAQKRRRREKLIAKGTQNLKDEELL